MCPRLTAYAFYKLGEIYFCYLRIECAKLLRRTSNEVFTLTIYKNLKYLYFLPIRFIVL